MESIEMQHMEELKDFQGELNWAAWTNKTQKWHEHHEIRIGL